MPSSPRRLGLIAALLLAPLAGLAQTPKAAPTDAEKALAIQAQAFRAMDGGELPRAEQLLRQAIATDGSNFVFYYNLACVRSLQGKTQEGADALIDAVEHGFVDLTYLRHDAQLAAVRREPRIAKLMEAWPTVLTRHLEANLKAVASLFEDHGTTYITTRDEALRIAIMSAMDPKSTDQARADIKRLYDWGLANVFTDLADASKAQNDAWCVVVLPTPKDFVRWLVFTYGRDAVNSFAGIGGSYTNDQKRLVAQDLGATLRHEFFHVLHWRSMLRLGQDHPIWIQEGLCSLVEDYEAGETAGSLKPVASWRSNIARKLLTGGGFLSVKQLAAVPADRFTGSRPLANYAMARTFFLYLSSMGRLRDWYSTYTSDPEKGYASDRTGIAAIEAVLGKPIVDVDKDYRAWLRALPMVAEQNRPGAATLGVDVEQGDGDGPVIVEIPRDERGQPNPARHAGLKVGDVITAIDGKPTRDLNELVRLLGEHRSGDEVEVSYRRGKIHGATRLQLVPR
jgi:hypothetical protein